jgi:hypothetical protein
MRLKLEVLCGAMIQSKDPRSSSVRNKYISVRFGHTALWCFDSK